MGVPAMREKLGDEIVYALCIEADMLRQTTSVDANPGIRYARHVTHSRGKHHHGFLPIRIRYISMDSFSLINLFLSRLGAGTWPSQRTPSPKQTQETTSPSSPFSNRIFAAGSNPQSSSTRTLLRRYLISFANLRSFP